MNAVGLTTSMNTYIAYANAQGRVAGRNVELLANADNLDEKKMVALKAELGADKPVPGLVGYLDTGGLATPEKDSVPTIRMLP